MSIAISANNPSLLSLDIAVKKLMEVLNNQYTLVTLGAKGMYCAGEGKSSLLPARERKVADVCGAGDTVISLVALGVAAKPPVETTIMLANIAGGQVCEEVGVVPINKTKLFQEYWARVKK